MRIAILVLFLLATVGCGFDARQTFRAKNGARCVTATDCEGGMACEETPYYPWPVCTGTRNADESCSADTQCKYTLDDRGLPLRCVDGICKFEERILTTDATSSN